MYKRYGTKKILINNIQVGNQNKIVIQSMTNIKTEHVIDVIKQIKLLAMHGCELVRVSVLDEKDANALKKIVELSPIPVIADIHFDYKLALMAIVAKVPKIRINPSNITNENELKEICDLANKYNTVIRIGVNSGSIPDHILNQHDNIAKFMVDLATKYIEQFQKYNFNNLVISLKSSDPFICMQAYKMFSEKYNYPLHIGVTEAGDLIDSAIKSSIGLAPILLSGIGDTIRISISDDPVKEIYVAKKILNTLGLRHDMVNIISCPSCGRLQYDLFNTIHEIKEYTKFINKPITISILGCIVNGIQEGKHADIGIAGSQHKCILFKKNTIYKTIDAKDAIKELKNLIDEFLKENH